MSRDTIPVELYMEAARVFHWATKRHFQLWFTGEEKPRHSRSEKVLKRLAQRGKLRSVRYGKGLVYALPRKTKGVDDFDGLGKIAHGLVCTEGLVRFYRSRLDGEIIAERFFYGLGAVPEWGIRYPNGKMLLFEYCSKSNFYYSGNLRGKLAAYRRHLPTIEEKFRAKAVVVFTCDVAKSAVERYVGSVAADDQAASSTGDTFPSDPFFFVDYETFLKEPIGNQLKAPIYRWFDGKDYSLT